MLGSAIQPEFYLQNVPERGIPIAVRNPDGPEVHLNVPARPQTEQEAWQNFEAEYRPDYEGQTAVKRKVQLAKYGLDCAIFAFQRFSQRADQALEFKMEVRRNQRGESSSRPHLLDNACLKVDVQTPPSKPYVGVRVILPLGN